MIATFRLPLVVFGVTRGGRGNNAPFAVGAYMTGAYFFTSSTSFANPVTVARTLSDTFAGVAPSSVLPFVVAQIVGAALACGATRVLWPRIDDSAQRLIIPRQSVDGTSQGTLTCG